MKQLFIFELGKIVRRKLTVIVMAVSIVITGILFGLPGLRFQYVTKAGTLNGSVGIEALKADYALHNVIVEKEPVAGEGGEASYDADTENVADGYGYHEGWKKLYSCFDLMIIVLLSICICVAPTFSGEYQAGTDSVILSGKYGKTKLSTAKIIAAMVFATGAYIVHVIIAFGAMFMHFGASGWNLPVQADGFTVPYALTYSQMAVINIVVVFVVLMALVSFTLFLSANSRTPLAVVTILLPIFFIPVFVAPTGTTGALNVILRLMPYRATMPEIDKFVSFDVLGRTLDLWTVRLVFYSILLVVCIPLAKICFKKHRVA